MTLTILNGNLFESDYIDQIALNGLFDLSTGDTGSAIQKWNCILVLSGAAYNQENQKYIYPNISESYHLGLFEILTGFLMDAPAVDASKKQELVSHWVSLRSNILSDQETSGSRLLGWRSNVSDPNSLINTESIAVNVLGLGAGAIHVFEAGQAPLQMENNNYFVRPHHVLSAVKEFTDPGVYGSPWPKSKLSDWNLRGGYLSAFTCSTADDGHH